jgi:hypothetical protein
VKILRSYAVTLLDLAKKSSVDEGNTTAQHFNVKILKVFMFAAAPVINAVIPIQLNFNVIIFRCDNTVNSHALKK